MRLDVTLDVTPQRVTVGKPSMARLEIANRSSRRVTGLGVELPVGVSAAHFTTPLLAPGASYEEWVTIPTSHRGVVTIGPVQTQRGDPFGLVRRQLAWAGPTELFVHPGVAAIDELGTGLLRDLEGQATQDVSTSDLEFHALREYEPGDDARHIHWPSSARATAMAGEQRFLVRQFLDTRRSHVVVIADVQDDVYASGDEFELALSCAASVAVRAIGDGMDLTIVAGGQKQTRPAPHAALDTFSRAERSGAPGAALGEVAKRLAGTTADASLCVLVTGRACPFGRLELVRLMVPMVVGMVVIRACVGNGIALRATSGFTELSVGALDDLPRALRGRAAV